MAAASRPRSVVRMLQSTRNLHSDAPGRAALAVLGAIAINALVFSPAGDQGFIAMVLLGPPLTGLVAALRRRDVRLVAAAWALSGLCWLAGDWIVNDEDQLFHLVLTVLMAALTFLGAAVARLGVVLRKRARPSIPAGQPPKEAS
jgi:apolipoprotein N-acyltransferase